MQRVLDAITDVPAWVRNARHDLLAANTSAKALYAPMVSGDGRPANTARFIYLDPASRAFAAHNVHFHRTVAPPRGRPPRTGRSSSRVWRPPPREP
ncbi:hypothetical protein [Nocardia fluminea]|uniref:MmyB family transcriptional regulator n=1 Tax=Nocardia fluminea TaxID=134984 RepID=UPI003D13B74E